MSLKITQFIVLAFMSLGFLAIGQSSDLGLKHLENVLVNNGLFYKDVKWKVTSHHTSSISGIEHFYLIQEFNGLVIVGTESALHLSEDDKLLSKHVNYVSNIDSKINRGLNPELSPIEVIKKTARTFNYFISEDLKEIPDKTSNDTKTVVSNGGFSLRNIPCVLMYLLQGDTVHLVWNISIYETNELNWWNLYVDASSGEILKKENWISTCDFVSEVNSEPAALDYNKNLVPNPSEATINNQAASNCSNCYEVIELPMMSPYYGDRTIVEDPAHLTASPYGWHDQDGVEGPEFTGTNGNNVWAFEREAVSIYVAEGGPNLDFTNFSFNPIFTAAEPSKDAALTNLFYIINTMHDIVYQYGFDEVAGNFQQNNYGRGGQSSDVVHARAQIEFGSNCNANFGIPLNGENPFLNVYQCNSRDGAFDATVILHEYAHGIVERLWGGTSVNQCGDPYEKMAEGYCDWYALMLTIAPDDVGEMPKGIASYLRDLGATSNGIRTYPYSTNMASNPQTYSDIQTNLQKHYQGAVWAEILWEVTWELIDQYGFDPNMYNFTGDISQDAGNIMALAIITESLKIIECGGGFVAGRDAVLMANRAIYGGYSECLLWEAFAKRGLGFFSANGRESFQTPPIEASLDFADLELCLLEGTITGIRGGSPFGGVYSGPGVIDDENGISFSFDTTVVGLGPHVVTYDVPSSSCNIASSHSDSLVVYVDTSPPRVNCVTEIRVSIDRGETFTIPDYSDLLTYEEQCIYPTVVSQNIVPGTEVEPGYTEIILIATDPEGQSGQCSINLIVEVPDEVLSDFESTIKIFPNPVNQEFAIYSASSEVLIECLISDTRGRTIKRITFKPDIRVTTVDVSEFAAGTYFLKIISASGETAVKQLIKY